MPSFRPGAKLARPVMPHRLSARAPGPTTWAWAGNVERPLRPATARGSCNARAPSDAHPTAIMARGAHQNRRPAASPRTLISFLPPPSLSTPAAASGEREGDGAGNAAPCRRRGGAAELCSPEVCAVVAGAQLRRALLVGALMARPPARA